jgi:hypothetical protein
MGYTRLKGEQLIIDCLLFTVYCSLSAKEAQHDESNWHFMYGNGRFTGDIGGYHPGRPSAA